MISNDGDGRDNTGTAAGRVRMAVAVTVTMPAMAATAAAMDDGSSKDNSNSDRQWQQPQQPAATGNQHQPSFWNPAAAATMVAMAGSGMSNDAMIDFASNAGKSFLQSGSARMVPGLESKMHMLRRYFAVDNHYVKIKMRKILFPFFDKQWTRVVRFCSMKNTAILDENVV